MQITKDKVATFHYTLKNGDGQVIESSKESDPLSAIQGQGNIIPGLESALEGKAEGESFEVTIAPSDAYGEIDERLTKAVPIEELNSIDNLHEGMQLRARSESGEHMVTVSKITEREVTLDANHPMAGETLNFEIEIVAVRDATSEELEHGHPHGPGGHAH